MLWKFLPGSPFGPCGIFVAVYIEGIGKEGTDIRTSIQNGKVWCGLVSVPTC